MNIRKYLVLILCLIVTSFVNAKEGFVQLDGTEINIQLKKELVPVSKVFPEFFLSASYESKSSILPLEFYIPANDLILFLEEKQPALGKVIGLSISEDFVVGEINRKDFSKFRKMLGKQFRDSNSNNPNAKVLFDNANSFGYRSVIKDPKQRVKAQSFLLVKGKMLELEISAVYKSEKDLRWVDESLAAIVNSLIDLNKK
ncbi:MAG TPA: hypothetical protein EYQ06_05895 [Flavobacteriales bacterium]|nr:hypothetical protein [Flavobacteriales bacterium]